jgi:hypothetical protein
MIRKRRLLFVVAGLAAACAVVVIAASGQRNRSDADLLVGLLRIKALPEGTQIAELRKDLMPDTVVEAHLIVPAGANEKLIAELTASLALEEQKSEPTSRYGVKMTKHWQRHFTNGDFKVECDDSGRHVYVFYAVD